VKPTTAWHRANGRVSRHAAREAQQALTHAEEDQEVSFTASSCWTSTPQAPPN
jgi:hypothetical protein